MQSTAAAHGLVGSVFEPLDQQAIDDILQDLQADFGDLDEFAAQLPLETGEMWDNEECASTSSEKTPLINPAPPSGSVTYVYSPTSSSSTNTYSPSFSTAEDDWPEPFMTGNDPLLSSPTTCTSSSPEALDLWEQPFYQHPDIVTYD